MIISFNFLNKYIYFFFRVKYKYIIKNFNFLEDI
jgi:hypothetical protein